MRSDGRLLRGAVLAAVGAGLLAPIALGLWETLRPAFGVLPALGRTAWSLEPWAELAALPGVRTSLMLTLWTGIGSTVLSLLLALGAAAALYDRIGGGRGGRWLTPFLAIPHAAMAVGLAFVLAPSGWLARLLAEPLGWTRPPDIASVNDPWGLALMIGLMIKEIPFLLLVILAALGQLPVRRHMAMGRALGYGRGIVWIKVIVPQLWPLIRLPVWVVLSYALSNVDMALVLGPSTPPVLAVAVMRWFTDPDITMLLPASAGAILQAGVVLAGVALFRAAELAAARLGRWWLRRGGRGLSFEPGLVLARGLVLALLATGALAMLSLAVWSVAWRWSFPHVLPESWSAKPWQMAERGWREVLGNTLLLALASVGVSLALAVAWLEGEDRARRGRAGWAEALIYLPLLLPQIGFLYGLNVVFLRLGVGGTTLAVIWAQALFVFPYVMITLSDPWRALDPRLVNAAAALGASPLRRLWAVKLPVLLHPIATAAAIGVAVSVAQYLPTLFMGAGRVPTLTTEAVTLSSGADRRIVGVYATLQAALPFAAYGLAFLIPALLHRNRADLRGTA